MRKSLQVLGCLAILAIPMIALPVHAQSSDGTPPPAGKGGGMHDEWRGEHQEMEGMREEREQLESERAGQEKKLADEGQAVKGIQFSMEDLRQRSKRLTEEILALEKLPPAPMSPMP